MKHGELHVMAVIQLMPAQVAVMTVLYKSVKSTDYIGKDIGFVAHGVSGVRNGTLHGHMVRVRDSTKIPLVVVLTEQYGPRHYEICSRC